ncbi:MAG: hypothetical protein HKL95_11195 [Phycisphaerae bacterium]|nr:hypothetical protein [Phycisphaerae bacterium]
MTNSKTYRSQNVQAVKLEAMLAGHDGESAVVGVDVGKEQLYLAVRWPDGQTERPMVVNQSGELGMAMEFLQKLSKDRRLRVALEPSGTYGDPFRYACHRVGLAAEGPDDRGS